MAAQNRRQLVSTLSIWDEREQLAIAMHIEGYTQPEIGVRLGINQGNVSRLISDAFARARSRRDLILELPKLCA